MTTYLDAVTDRVALPITTMYTGMPAAADVEVFVSTTAFTILKSIHVDLGLTQSALTRAHLAR